MFEGQTHDPKVFILALRQFQDAAGAERGELANALAEAITSKRVDLAEVRQALLDAGDEALMNTLDQLVELIEPYLIEGGAEE